MKEVLMNATEPLLYYRKTEIIGTNTRVILFYFHSISESRLLN